MNDTTPSTEPPSLEKPPGPATPTQQPGFLMDLIIAFLTPMFLGVAGGDIHFARMAAAETLNTYRCRNQIDLIAIAQIIACGLTALGSLSLSMADNLSLSMTLRLRGNAVALNRAAEQNRRALRQSDPDNAPEPTDPPFTPGSDDAEFEAQVLASVAATRKLATELQARPQNPEPSATPTPIPTPTLTPAPAKIPPFAASASPPAAVPEMTDRQRQALWAFAMTDVASEFTTDLKNLPPAERKMASRRAAALSSCANQLLLGNVAAPLELADLAAIIRPNVPR